MTTDRRYGLLLIDKDAGPTSFNVIAGLRRLIGLKKIGHAGTLDPFATGLLTVAFGKATSALHHLQGLDKTYDVGIRLGVSTDSGDSDGDVTERRPVSTAVLGPAHCHLDEAMAGLTGDLMQVPPMQAAIKVDGKRLYQYAREGRTVERAARPIRVHEMTCTGVRPNADTVDLAITLHVSSGTYVRQLAVSLGERLGVPAHAFSLRRTSVGPFQVDDAHRLEPWFDVFNAQGRDSSVFFHYLENEGAILPVRAAYFNLPFISLDEEEAAAALHGRPLDLDAGRIPPGVDTGSEVFLCYNGADVALARWAAVAGRQVLLMKKVWGEI